MTLCQNETTAEPLKTYEHKEDCARNASMINISWQKETANESIRQRKENFLKTAAALHNGKYNYSSVKYFNNRTEVEISCPLHGIFFQRPDHHLAGSECPQCGAIKSNSKRTKLQSEFILAADTIHKYKYGYSKVLYKGAFHKVIIICPKHAEFLQTPDHHLRGCGCSKCIPRVSKVETDFLNYLNIPYYNRQVFISKHKFHIDGLDPHNNIVYEFLGDYYHGNPDKFKKDKYNKICHKTYGQLYQETMNRFFKLKTMGYYVKYVWENDWRIFRKQMTTHPKIQEY